MYVLYYMLRKQINYSQLQLQFTLERPGLFGNIAVPIQDNNVAITSGPSVEHAANCPSITDKTRCPSHTTPLAVYPFKSVPNLNVILTDRDHGQLNWILIGAYLLFYSLLFNSLTLLLSRSPSRNRRHPSLGTDYIDHVFLDVNMAPF